MTREGGGGNILARVFFPPSDAAAQALAVWGVFAVGFVTRPLGALLFGHFGDTRGRGITLLLSVLGMGVPTVLIGCLPGYKEIGIAAPALLVALRAVQGIAMGGEFGTALVYLYEVAPEHQKGLLSSLGCVCLGLGVAQGAAVVAAVAAFMPPASLLTLGWRIPFLASSLTLVAAIIVRFNMPESTEFAISHDEIEQEFHRRLQQQQQRRKQEQQQQQQQAPNNSSSRPSRYSCSLAPIPSCSDLSCSTRPEGVTNSNAKSKSNNSRLDDLEAVRKLLLAERHYVPVVELLRGHWGALLLQCGYQASMSSIPMFIALSSKSLAACWLSQAATLALAGAAAGMLPAVCCSLYPAGVRISGVCLGFHAGMLAFGAIKTAAGPLLLAPGAWMTALAVLSIVCAAALARLFPHANGA
ncbi:hypothetical protein OEZ85_014310 [Tetradesmus obliquus]|uniref:Major facilitator superfamily (MFS) profile domain-containing protein n=1 Tax=Tetradesmus obliquus TaxID=3088 RepID=A0ABY8U7Z0_TETOB|nr:hypothetical protein OEZ85_014310 [Tetradesmus obliquus]